MVFVEEEGGDHGPNGAGKEGKENRADEEKSRSSACGEG
jgi:hypothetical protein